MKDPRSSRLLVLAGFLAVVLLAYLGVLFDTQVTHHEEYLAQSLHSITDVEDIEASRGIITDRKGRPLVSNTSVYDLNFDTDLLRGGEDPNTAILRLLKLCQAEGLAWIDTLPISEEAPYSYTLDSLSSTQKGRFLSYLKSVDAYNDLLVRYLLDHPELAETTEEDEAQRAEMSQNDWGELLLKRMPLSAFTSAFLVKAGIAPAELMAFLQETAKLTEPLSQSDTRQVLGIRYELLVRKLTGYTDCTLVENIDTVFISKVTDGNFSGADVVSSSIRKYETAYAAHILGYVTTLQADDDLETLLAQGYNYDDQIGRSGVEAAFESYLKGQNGRRVISTNSEGRITGEYYSIEPKPGNTVELTIDLELQKVVEDALAETVQRLNADPKLRADADKRGAGAVVEKIGTGEILALASYPTYDLSTFRQADVWAALNADPSTPMVNRATQGTYAPGSTLKPLTATAALEEGTTTLSERIRDTGRWVYPNDPTDSGAMCWIGYPGHGLLNVSQAITNSCNYFFAEMGYRMGMDTLAKYLSAFGLGESTGIEIGDKPGKLPENNAGENQAPWAAFGQGNQLYTPLQLANYLCTLISGGDRYETRLLKSVKTYDNAEVVAVGDTQPVETINISDSTLEAVKKGMLGYTQPGGMVYTYFKDCIVTAGAKTGTAQLGENQTNNGVFICFAPYDDPEIAVSIVIEKGGAGAALASTAVKILNAYFSSDEIGALILSENQLLP